MNSLLSSTSFLRDVSDSSCLLAKSVASPSNAFCGEQIMNKNMWKTTEHDMEQNMEQDVEHDMTQDGKQKYGAKY